MQGDVFHTMAGVGATPVHKPNTSVRLRVAIVPNKCPFIFILANVTINYFIYVATRSINIALVLNDRLFKKCETDFPLT